MVYMKFKALIGAIFITLITLTTIVYDSTHGALTRLKITRVTLSSPNIPTAFDELNLIYFSDLHAFTLPSYYYQKTITEINALNPDFVVFGGDLIDESSYASYSEAQRQELIDLLRSIKAPYGKYAILSQDDQSHQTELQTLYLEAGFEILNAKLIPIHVLGDATINFLGWDENSDQELLTQILPTTYTIAYSHDPALSAQLDGKGIATMFAGKTHGGQVTLPLIGPLTMKNETFQKGHYQLTAMDLYVSTGIGVSNLKARWLTDPSVILVTFKSN